MRDYSVLDKLEEGVQIIDKETRYVYLNQTLLGEVRQTSDDMIGQRMEDKFPGIEQSEIYLRIIKCLNNGGKSTVVNEFRFPDGRHTFYEIKIQAIDEGVIVFSRDITKTRKGQILLQETNRQLEHFVYITSHDLREPIRRISVLSEELVLDFASSLPQSARLLCNKIQFQAARLMQLVNDFRTLSGLGSKALVKEEVSIFQIARGCADELKQGEYPNIEIHFPDEDLILQSYPTLLNILFKNLMENAIKYGDGQVEVTIDKGNDQGSPVISIVNKTLQPQTDKDIFLPFVKGNTLSGTGLGLTICKKIIALHNGKIWSHFENGEFSVNFSLG